jgi:hypothetical protein
MDAARYYRSVNQQLCQGDIFEGVPHLILKTPPTALKPTTLTGKKPGFTVEELASAKSNDILCFAADDANNVT